MRTDFVINLGDRPKRLWTPGVFAIEHVATGRRHYVGTSCLGRRVRDNVNWLNLGVHHNRDLQADWSRDRDQFRLLLVERVAAADVIGLLKQSWIDRDRRDRGKVPYNLKNALPATGTRPSAGELALPHEFLFQPEIPAPTNVFDRVISILGNHAFEGHDLTPSQLRHRAETMLLRVKQLGSQ